MYVHITDRVFDELQAASVQEDTVALLKNEITGLKDVLAASQKENESLKIELLQAKERLSNNPATLIEGILPMVAA